MCIRDRTVRTRPLPTERWYAAFRMPSFAAGAEAAVAVEMASLIATSPATLLAGVFTHLAIADEPDHGFTDPQLDRFDGVIEAIRADLVGRPEVPVEAIPDALHADGR